MYGQFLFTTKPVASLRTEAALGAVRTPVAPLTADEVTALARSATDGYARAGLIGLTFVVLVGGLLMAVARPPTGCASDVGHTPLWPPWAPPPDSYVAACWCSPCHRSS